MSSVTQPRREHASVCRNCNIQTVKKDMHYPCCQELDQELQVVTWRSNYIDFQVISILLQESSHKGLILENPKEEPPTSTLCHDKTIFQAKEILIIDLWSCFTIKANHQDQAGGLSVVGKSHTVLQQHSDAFPLSHFSWRLSNIMEKNFSRCIHSAGDVLELKRCSAVHRIWTRKVNTY